MITSDGPGLKPLYPFRVVFHGLKVGEDSVGSNREADDPEDNVGSLREADDPGR